MREVLKVRSIKKLFKAPGSLPDIDMDFESERRDDLKRYMEERFGGAQVASVGTYTTFQLRACLKDIGKLYGAKDFEEVNYITKFIDEDDSGLTDLFKKAMQIPALKKFILKYPEVINTIDLVLGAPKARSVHACAMIIFPKERDMYTWTPVRLQGGQIITEFEGNELEQAGFLKEDILGVRQLSKFKNTIKLIKDSKGVEIDIYNVDLEDKEVYRYFKNGWNGDVFHFGSRGLTKYCVQLQPENIDDLIAGISLYRPGAIENNFHNEYTDRKEGKKKVEYFTGSESILSKTYGVFVYQEQIMQLCQVLGGLSLQDADDVRKAMVKKKYDELLKYKGVFLEHYVKEFGVTQEYADEVWDKIDKASTYLFNKSHATAYSVTGYISQWLKVNYPLEYWTTALSMVPEGKKAELIPNFISEIHETGSIMLYPPDVNKSEEVFNTEFSSNSIFWSISSIKGVGKIAVAQIMEERKENGDYFSFEEFYERHRFTGSKVNKTTIEGLIYSGAFDKTNNVVHYSERRKLIEEFRTLAKIKSQDEKMNVYEEWYYPLKQKQLCGYATFNYQELVEGLLVSENFLRPSEIQSAINKNRFVSVGGVIQEVIQRNSKKGKWGMVIIESNYTKTIVRLWAETWKDHQEALMGAEGSILIASGRITYDSYNDSNLIVIEGRSKIILKKI